MKLALISTPLEEIDNHLHLTELDETAIRIARKLEAVLFETLSQQDDSCSRDSKIMKMPPEMGFNWNRFDFPTKEKKNDQPAVFSISFHFKKI